MEIGLTDGAGRSMYTIAVEYFAAIAAGIWYKLYMPAKGLAAFLALPLRLANGLTRRAFPYNRFHLVSTPLLPSHETELAVESLPAPALGRIERIQNKAARGQLEAASQGTNIGPWVICLRCSFSRSIIYLSRFFRQPSTPRRLIFLTQTSQVSPQSFGMTLLASIHSSAISVFSSELGPAGRWRGFRRRKLSTGNDSRPLPVDFRLPKIPHFLRFSLPATTASCL